MRVYRYLWKTRRPYLGEGPVSGSSALLWFLPFLCLVRYFVGRTKQNGTLERTASSSRSFRHVRILDPGPHPNHPLGFNVNKSDWLRKKYWGTNWVAAVSCRSATIDGIYLSHSERYMGARVRGLKGAGARLARDK
jgi:hypothetical protein